MMRHAVQAWLKPLAGEVLHVRYRLLRGDLTIHDMRIKQGQWAIHVSRISLHTSTRAMLSKTIHFSRVRLDTMQLSFPRTDLINGLHGEPSDVMRQWFSIINDADELILTNGTFHFSDEKVPWQVRKVSGHIAARGFDLSGNVNGGSLRLRGKQDSASFRGKMDWQGMLTTGLIRILGLKTHMHGSSSGLLNWHADWPHRHFMFDGDIRLENQPDHGEMHIQGKMEPESINVQARCRGLSLTGLGKILPAVNGRSVRSGILNGDVRFERQGDGHRVVGMSGEIHGVRLASENLPVWTIDSIMLNNAVAQWPAHKLNVERVHIRNMDMALQPGKTRPSVSPWHFQVANLTFEDVRPAINIHEGSRRLILPPLKGSGHMETNGYMELDAVSEGEEIWHIIGKGHGDKLFHASINAKNVPVVRLRPLLPDLSLPGSSGPLQLSGNSQLQVSLQVDRDKLILKGQATMTGVMASQGGDTFLADSIHIDIQQAGTLSIQHLGSIRMNEWRYQAALHPIPHSVEAEAAKKTEVRHKGLSWQVDEVTAKHGAISVGSEDAVWADHASFSLKNIRSGTWSPLVFNASVGGGSLRIRGRMDWLASDVKMKLNVRLRDALPFFLNNWLMVSGSPRLTRGRLDGTLFIKPAHEKHAYTGTLNIILHQGQFESGTYPQDPMLMLMGYSMQDLLDRLGKRGHMSLHIPYRGDWRAQPFPIRRMGLATLNVIRQRAPLTGGLPSGVQPVIKTVSHLRLQHGRAFSHNEHARLWQVVKALHKQPKLIVELLPQLGHTPLDESLISRIRHTQAMIEYYMHTRGISRSRIYPVWPTVAHRHGDITGIKITARMP
ncbi:MAG: hypothetical protein Q9M27_01535, partial [Mariprofundaceae bacterium]|nr:hypothetical protein [Mariprofundaceae bacterium]